MRTHLGLLQILVLVCAVTIGCDADDPAEGSDDAAVDVQDDGADIMDTDVSADTDGSMDSVDQDVGTVDGDLEPPGPTITVMTFNTGTGPELLHDGPPDDGYSSADAAITDTWYGNGLNYPPLIAETAAFFTEVQPDIVVFQEIFWSGECATIPPENHVGLVCEGWMPGDATVAQTLLGAGYQLMCHPEKPDKCAAVKRSFGSFRGCASDFCLEGMEGYRIDMCGGGARVARGVIDPVDGSDPITLINYHGTSGFTVDESKCRVQQIDEVFVELGSTGEPGANGVRNLIMGDLNTDPGRVTDGDASAARWWDFAGDGLPFQFISDVGNNAIPTYAGFFNIDHVLSDAFEGRCWSPDATPGRDPFTQTVFFDHLPVVCELWEPAP